MTRWSRFAAALAAVALLPAALAAATYEGRPIDEHWYEGRAVSTTYGAYDCHIKFHENQVLLQLAGLQIVAILDDEVITDPHEILVHDPRRGVDWTLDCYNLTK